MKKALFLFTITLFGLTTVGFGQKVTRQAVDTPTDANVKSQPIASEDNDNGTGINAGTMLQGELQSTVDVNKTQVGDRVVVKTTTAVKQGGKTVVGKGTRLVGRVTDIARRTKDNTQSRIGMLFDRIEGTGLSRPISLTVVSITNTRANTGFEDDQSAFPDAGMSTGNSISGNTARPPVGGLVRSVPGVITGAVGTVTNRTAAAANSVREVAGSATQTAGSTVRDNGNTVRNIDLRTEASAATSTTATLSSNDKNFKIEKGTTVNFRVDK